MKLQELVTKSRKLELQYLVREGRLTPAIATRLEAIWCSEDVLKLSTEHNEVDSLFDQTLEALKELPTIIELGEKSNSQVIALRQNQGEEQLESPIIRSAKLMAEKAYNKNGVK